MMRHDTVEISPEGRAAYARVVAAERARRQWRAFAGHGAARRNATGRRLCWSAAVMGVAVLAAAFCAGRGCGIGVVVSVMLCLGAAVVLVRTH